MVGVKEEKHGYEFGGPYVHILKQPRRVEPSMLMV